MTDEEINPITTYSYSTDDELFEGEFDELIRRLAALDEAAMVKQEHAAVALLTRRGWSCTPPQAGK